MRLGRAAVTVGSAVALAVAAGRVPAGKAGGPAFQAVFPTARLSSLPCA